MEKTVVKAVGLLEALARSDAPRGVTELSRELELTKSNVHRLLETLRETGYVKRQDSGTYCLSLKIWQLGRSVISRIDLKDIALPHLEELAAHTGETARLTVFENDQGVCIQQIQSSNPIGLITRVGGSLLPYCSATGKALLAYQPPEVVERVGTSLVKFTPRTVGSRAELEQQLRRIRRQGFAFNFGEWRAAVSGVAAPIWDGEGNVVAAIGVSGPTARLSSKFLQTLAPVVRTSALRLSAALGYADAGLDAVGG